MIARLVIFTVMLILARLASGQSQVLPMMSPPPPSVATVSAAYSGQPGTNTYYYWVIAKYPIGYVAPSPAGRITNVGTVSGSAPVTVSWNGVLGVTSYDILKTTTATQPSSCTCALATTVTTTSTSDTGGALSSYSVAATSPANGTIFLNNQDYSVPLLASTINGLGYTVPIVTTVGSVGQGLIYNANGTLTPSSTGGTGTVTSIATTAPITGGTITATGTIACATCTTSAAALTLNQLVFGAGSQGMAVGNLTGDVTTAGGKATTISALAVTNAMLAGSIDLTAKVTGVLPLANGGTGLAAAADNTVPVSNGTIFQAKAIPDCTDTAGQHLNYTDSSNTFSCGVSIIATGVTSAASLTLNQLVFGAGSQGIAVGDLTGDVTTSGGKATTIANSAVNLTTKVTGVLPLANGGTGLSSAADNTVPVSNGTIFEAKAIPDCVDTTGKHLNYTDSTNAFSCGTSKSVALNSCTAATLGTVIANAGEQCYCTDCKVTTVTADVVSNATCTGAGSGSLAVNVNGTAKCVYAP